MSNDAVYPSLKNKVVLVTGGASGIGESITRAMIKQGAKVGFLDFDEEAATKLLNELGEAVMLAPPVGVELPSDGFDCEDSGYIMPENDGSKVVVSVNPKSERLQLLEPFLPIGRDIKHARLLIKAHGKCTTDHISMAGPWLRYLSLIHI